MPKVERKTVQHITHCLFIPIRYFSSSVSYVIHILFKPRDLRLKFDKVAHFQYHIRARISQIHELPRSHTIFIQTNSHHQCQNNFLPEVLMKYYVYFKTLPPHLMSMSYSCTFSVQNICMTRSFQYQNFCLSLFPLISYS